MYRYFWVLGFGLWIMIVEKAGNIYDNLCISVCDLCVSYVYISTVGVKFLKCRIVARPITTQVVNVCLAVLFLYNAAPDSVFQKQQQQRLKSHQNIPNSNEHSWLKVSTKCIKNIALLLKLLRTKEQRNPTFFSLFINLVVSRKMAGRNIRKSAMTS